MIILGVPPFKETPIYIKMIQNMLMIVDDDNDWNRSREFKSTIDHNAEVDSRAKGKDGIILPLPRVVVFFKNLSPLHGAHVRSMPFGWWAAINGSIRTFRGPKFHEHMHFQRVVLMPDLFIPRILGVLWRGFFIRQAFSSLSFAVLSLLCTRFHFDFAPGSHKSLWVIGHFVRTR